MRGRREAASASLLTEVLLEIFLRAGYTSSSSTEAQNSVAVPLIPASFLSSLSSLHLQFGPIFILCAPIRAAWPCFAFKSSDRAIEQWMLRFLSFQFSSFLFFAERTESLLRDRQRWPACASCKQRNFHKLVLKLL